MECPWSTYSEVTDILLLISANLLQIYPQIFTDIYKYLLISVKQLEISANELEISPIILWICPVILWICLQNNVYI